MLDTKTVEEIKKIVFTYLDPKTDKAFIYGSRATGGDRKFSDVDIGIVSKRRLDTITLSDIEEAFEESDIPYTVDVVDFSKVTNRFRNLALQKILPLN